MSTELPNYERTRSRGPSPRISALAFVGFLTGCGPDGPARLGITDGGVRDGSTLDGSATYTSGRVDGGAVLPVADREVVLVMGAPETLVRYSVDAEPAMLDVHLSVDTTGSFVEEIDALETELGRDVLPAIRQLVSRSSFGLSYFQDFPAFPFGGPDDRPFVLLQRITDDDLGVGRAVLRLDDRIGNGGDLPESGFESIFQVARGTGYSGGGLIIPRLSGAAASGGGSRGGVGFRDESFRVLVHATDAISHDASEYADAFPDTHGRDDALAALIDEHIYFVGISNGGSPRSELSSLALATHAYVAPIDGTCPTGVDGTPRAPIGSVCPLVFDVLPDGTGLSNAIVGAIAGLVSSIDYDEVVGTVSEDRLGFVEGVRATSASVPAGAPSPGTADSTPTDGIPDTFTAVRAGARLEFDLILRNDTFPSATYEQTFRIRLRILADSAVVVDEWVRIVVPADPG